MKILAMQATFGKLDNQTITFQPEMNVIHAPNEWGKTTWCAFIAAMLYGIDTRERNTLTALADKERYAPWSGKPMAGRMDLEWNGRKITIERSTKGRSIFGVFAAYETDSGLPIPELTGENCGLTLLGVEKSVFLKSAFIRQNDMPVTQDEALRRRLNALVTTGDESGASDRLSQKLKDLKNACRHNKTGLLPQAEGQRDQIQGKLDQLYRLRSQEAEAIQRLQALVEQVRDLENHQAALAYEAAQADRRRVEEANAATQAAADQVSALEAGCRTLPTEAEAQKAVAALAQLREEQDKLQNAVMPTLPDPPAQKAPFHGLDPQQAQAMLDRDMQQYAALKNNKQYFPYIIIALSGLVAAALLAFALPHLRAYAPLLLVAGLLPLIIKRVPHATDHKLAFALERKYGSADLALWQAMARSHIESLENHAAAMANYETQRNTLRQAQTELQTRMMDLTQGAPISAAQRYWEQVLADHRALETARKEHQQAVTHAQAVSSMLRQAEAPQFPDTLTLTPQQTMQALANAAAQRNQLQSNLGQIQGQAASLGDEEALQKELYALQCRIEKLEKTYAALELAQKTLDTAAQELQRQFAPRISKRAAELFQIMTDGRYDRLALDQDLTVQTATQEETTLRKWQYRSDGTADQLYLALRLSVAEELIPEAPVILDDALVRFDDERMEKAMQLLRQTSIHRQVILFSCQNREKSL